MNPLRALHSRQASLLGFLLLSFACSPDEPTRLIKAGRYQGDGIAVTLRRDGGAWSGRIELGERTFEAQATRSEQGLSGTFKDGATQHPFRMVALARGWDLESGGTHYTLQRQVSANPLAKGNPLAKEGGASTPTETGKSANPAASTVSIPLPDMKVTDAGRVAVSGKVYEHPLGFRFRYPEAWQLRQVEEGILSLTPGDLLQNADGPLEIILVLGDSADGLSDPASPRIAEFLDRLLAASFPFFKRTGKVETRRMGAQDFSRHAWRGKSPTGKTFEARAWACIQKDTALGLVCLMPNDQLTKRKAVLEAMAASFHFVEPSKDPQLVGGWRNESYYSSGSFGATTSRYMELRSDGTSTWGSRLMAGMSHHDSGGNQTGSTSADSGAGKVLKGRWSAAKKRLYIIWESGSEEEFAYYREGNSMLLTPVGGGKKQLWKKVR